MDEVRRFCQKEDDLWLIHVAEPDPAFIGWDAGPETVRDSVAQRFHEEHRALQKIADDLRDEDFSCVALLVQGGYAEAILNEAEKLEPSLIVMGTHGKGILRQAVLGSVSQAVLRDSKYPVLLIPTH